MKHSTWNFIYGASLLSQYQALGDSTSDIEFDLESAMAHLREWPLSLIGWPCNNTHRLDYTTSAVYRDPCCDNRNLGDSNTLFPWDEIAYLKLNMDPFALVQGNGGFVEYDGTAFLLPYWMGRYFGFIEN